MQRISIQYLEDSPELASLSPQKVAETLRAAMGKIPLKYLLIGWNLPAPLLEACKKECQQAGSMLYRWHPLLTGDGVLVPRREWQVVGLDGNVVPGFQNMPEFTFLCPNRPEVKAAVYGRLEQIIDSRDYQGLFLDRIRFPSPAANPMAHLGCFCEACQAAAAGQGMDLLDIRAELLRQVKTPGGRADLVLGWLRAPQNPDEALQKLLNFRCQSITRFVQKLATRAHEAGLEVSLDCFSPMLARMVGQDLEALGEWVEWIKLMLYAHTFGPAGLPYELTGLANFLIDHGGMGETQAMTALSRACGIPLPSSRHLLRSIGLNPTALQMETLRGNISTPALVLAGMELVEIPGVAELYRTQVEADLQAVKEEEPNGLAISWDLRHIPLERLDWVRKIWLGKDH